MAVPQPFQPVLLICGIISGDDVLFRRAEDGLVESFDAVDLTGPAIPFDLTEYYAEEMGTGLRRKFLSFDRLIAPQDLSGIKIRTNALEEALRDNSGGSRRPVNIDPGYLTSAALIMATAKNFAHRIPLDKGIYAHLEFLFGKHGIRTLDWTYPDFRRPDHHAFFQEARKRYLNRIRAPEL
ncbi:MAG: DUF4416 family protein [Acidobacteriota bacterium]|nr:DUF4416 family protein [Acidobacteriota bacterium]